ncbi:MAG: DUF92 domain-containing protein, partial [Oscillospiraceae bacterium]|nr:DUF92 domain-containing protein [Oscillospiraceae bacterium]
MLVFFGRRIKTITFESGKTLAGSASVAIISFIVIFIINMIFGSPLNIFAIVVLSLVAAVLENIGHTGYDNLTLPIGLSVVTYLLFNLEVLMNHLVLSLLLNSLLVIFAIKRKSFDTGGVISAFICGFLICYFGGIFPFAILMVVFLFTVLTDKISNDIKKQITTNIEKKGSKRDVFQVLVNAGPGAIAILLYYFTTNDVFIFIFGILMSATLADCMASNLGMLSSAKPVDITRFKKIDNGLSGGVTLIGITASLAGATIIGVTWFIYTRNILELLLIIFAGFLGGVIDSILGSLFQIKYKCE